VNQTTVISHWRYTIGDSSQWAEEKYDHSQWPIISVPTLIKDDSIAWFRRNINSRINADSLQQNVLYVPAAIGAYEVYLNSTRIGSSGTLSHTDRSDIRYPTLSQYYLIPQNLLKEGRNTLSLRVRIDTPIGGGIPYPVYLGEHSQIILENKHNYSLAFFLAGIFLITAIFHLFVLTYRGRRITNSLFGLYSFSCAGYVIVDSLIKYAGIHGSYFLFLSIIKDFFWLGLVVLLPLFLLSHFKASFRITTGIIITCISTCIIAMARLSHYNIIPLEWSVFWESMNYIYGYLATFFAVVITLGATLKKKAGSKTILSGLLLFFTALIIGTTTQGPGNSWIIGVSVLNIFITIAIARQLSHELKQSFQSQIKNTRLELELLKKHIHPHFLLNSLNSIVAWIEEDPATATKLINQLSKELRYLMAFAGQNTVILSEEIKLCATHLHVMNMRKEKNIDLLCEGDYQEPVKIPPLILHTIIENGLTHGFKKKDTGIFRIICTIQNRDFKLCIYNNGSSHGHSNSTGTGINYIKTRLREVFGSKWLLASFPVQDGWQWEITLKDCL
jgi:sensor histidine kinase YesM